MKLLRCPINGLRPVSEFQYAGEIRPMPDPDTCSDAQWTDYVFNRNGAPGVFDARTRREAGRAADDATGEPPRH